MPMLNFVVALSVEAKPIIQHFRLRKIPGNHGFTIFSNETIELIVSGVGTVAAAAATGYLAARQRNEGAAAWLNIGIAGSLSRDVGDAVLAHRVIDATDGRRYYPSLIINPMCETASIITVPKPATIYSGDRVYDMEAAGFYAAATRFNSNELIHCLKVISDNQHNSVDNVNATQVHALITAQIGKIAQLANEVQSLTEQLAPNSMHTDDYHIIIKRFHFTVSQQLQLKSQLNHWYALTNCSLLNELKLHHCRNAKTLLAELQNNLDAMPLSYQPSFR
ncbi:MAG: hypothetical protein GXP08_00320 [Gammaproteobacteria bacterium]|nr:hypothetical protein [Gammaproteobacteria bacterium]